MNKVNISLKEDGDTDLWTDRTKHAATINRGISTTISEDLQELLMRIQTSDDK